MQTWNSLTAPRGFLFIGDPHVSSAAPGRRIDDYLSTVIGKLARAAEICHSEQLVPVILGDLIHRDNESSTTLISRLSAVLRQFPCTPIELDGNHGKRQFRPSEGDIELLLAQWGFLRLVSDTGLVEAFDFRGVRVNLYACPHGEALPVELPAPIEGEVNVLITHHDMAFEGAYPGALPVAEVANCHMLVNGHMHKTMPSLFLGGMVAHNPGNIEPLSVDVASHLPAVWQWTPESLDFDLVRHLLPHDPECFDLTGVQVTASTDTVAAVESLKESQFARLLAGESSLDAHRTSDGSVLMDDLAAVCETAAASDATRTLLESLVRSITQGT